VKKLLLGVIVSISIIFLLSGDQKSYSQDSEDPTIDLTEVDPKTGCKTFKIESGGKSLIDKVFVFAKKEDMKRPTFAPSGKISEAINPTFGFQGWEIDTNSGVVTITICPKKAEIQFAVRADDTLGNKFQVEVFEKKIKGKNFEATFEFGKLASQENCKITEDTAKTNNLKNVKIKCKEKGIAFTEVTVSGELIDEKKPGSVIVAYDPPDVIFFGVVEILLPLVVGGDLLPIESTSLVLAGAQSFSWMIPVILSVLGIGLFVFRKSENS
jgi:hypothetical protein